MSITSLLVSPPLGRPNEGVLSVVGDLAECFDAHVEGIAPCQPIYASAAMDAELVPRSRGPGKLPATDRQG